jgi:dephospho-CoA kinase
MTIIGLTGPIAAGKDEVARLLKRQGVALIDADKLAHELYAPKTPAWHQLVKVFGSKILMRGGKVNRKKLGEIVFSDKKKLKQLNEIVHPALKKAVIEELKLRTPPRLVRLRSLQVRSGQANSKLRTLIVINAAVLKEIGLLNVVDKVWVVSASKENRLKRLIGSGLPRAAALNRINSQLSQAAYLKMADVVIRNDGTVKELARRVRELDQFS